MTAALTTHPVGLIDWQATDDQWLTARRAGISASDVSTALGFNPYQTPWELWAEKTGARRPDTSSNHAAQLGHDLEPWLLDMTARELNLPVTRTEYRLYAHPEYPWRMASPDGITAGGDLVEGKTAGLIRGFGTPDGWTEDSVPLGYHLQACWQMHVMDTPVVHMPALISGMGFRLYRLDRDLTVETDLVTQVADWHARHIIGGEEPELGHSDTAAIMRRWPEPTEGVIPLDDTDAHEIWMTYKQAHEAEQAASAVKRNAANALKLLLQHHEAGTIDGTLIATWKTREGAIDYKQMATDLAEAHRLELPPEAIYRKTPTRTLLVKGLNK